MGLGVEFIKQHIGMLKQTINKTKNFDKSIKSSYLAHLNTNNLYGWAMSQKLLVNGFECVEYLSKFNEDFIKKYDEIRA